MMHWTSKGASSWGGSREVEVAEKPLWGKVLETGSALNEIAQGILIARGEIRPWDIAAFAVRGLKTGLTLYHTWSKEQPVDLIGYFTAPTSPWKLTGFFSSKLAFEDIDIDEQMVEGRKQLKQGVLVSAAWTATVEGVEIGWVGPPGQKTVPTNIYSKTPERIRDVAAARLWHRAGTDRILRIQGDLSTAYVMPSDIIETQFLRNVEERARAFAKCGVPRSIVMDGEPGTGKTTAVGYLARKLNYRTVVVGAEEFLSARHDGRGEYFNSGVEFIEVLKPDMLIINDIDRVPLTHQVKLLEVFDKAKTYARLVFATTNHYRRLIEPVRRPGRLDDLIRVPGLDISEIHAVAPELASIAEKMVGWPIAYVRDMRDRYRVLGAGRGIAEFDEVAERLAEVRADGGYGQPEKRTNGANGANGAADETPEWYHYQVEDED